MMQHSRFGLGLLGLCAFVGCFEGGPDVDHSDFDRSCAADDECDLFVLEKVCSNCRSVPIGKADWERAQDAQVSAQWVCVPNANVCDNRLGARCVDGECEAFRWDEADSGMSN